MNYIPFIVAAILLAGGFGAGGAAFSSYDEDQDDVLTGGQTDTDPVAWIINSHEGMVVNSPDTVQLMAMVEGGNGELSYHWSIDGTTLLSNERNYLMNIDGTQLGGDIIIILTVTDEDGDTDSDTSEFEIGPPRGMTHTIGADTGNEFPIGDDDDLSFDLDREVGIFAFPRIDGPPPVEVYFTLTCRPFGLSSFYWNFNDGTGEWGGSSISHVFDQAGNYTVTYSTYVPVGPDNITMLGSVDIVILGGEPEEGITIDMDIPEFSNEEDELFLMIPINATPSRGIAPLYVNFHAYLPPGITTGFIWSFGDGGPASFNRVPSRVFIDPGTYHITIAYSDGLGMYGYGEIDIIVDHPMNNDFSVYIEVDTTVHPLMFHLKANPSIEASLIYDWNFSFGARMTGRQVVHSYPSYGLRYAIVHAYNEELGLNATARVEFFIPEQGAPNVHFIINTVPYDPSYRMFESIIGLGTSPFTYSWLFGDGYHSSESDPIHYYAEEGYYKVELYVLDDASGVGYYSEWVYVYSPTNFEPI